MASSFATQAPLVKGPQRIQKHTQIPVNLSLGCRQQGISHVASCKHLQSVHQAVERGQVVATAAAVAAEETEADDSLLTAKLRIKLKAFNVPIMREAEQQILDAAASTGATVSGPIPLPTRKKRWCVLRSPHVNKDSREHFEIRIHQRLIDVMDLSAETIDKFMNLDMPAGVEINVKLV